jgi:hypothetical protein
VAVVGSMAAAGSVDQECARLDSTASQNRAATSGAAEIPDLAHARRRGHVDLGHLVADDVDADQDEAALLQ